MKIAIDATCIGSALGGDETATLSLLRGLAQAVGPAGAILVLATAGAELPGDLTEAPYRVDRVRRRPGVVHFAATVPRWLRRLGRRGDRPDLVVTLTHAPLWSPAPVALLVPDLSFRHLGGAYPTATRLRLTALVGRQARSAAVVLTVSEFSRRDLISSYGLAPEGVHVVPLVIDPPAPPDPAARAALAGRGVRKPYVLYLGNLHPRKNVPLAITEFRAARVGEPDLVGHQFVVAGRPWFGSQAEAAAAAGAGPEEVLMLDRVSDAEREVLLRDAEALVYLSLFEGFGLPPLEAMARGTPVLAADRTAVPEVCADAALLVDPSRAAAVGAGLRRVLLDRPLRAELRTRGRTRAAEFTVARTAAALARAIHHATGAPVGAAAGPGAAPAGRPS